MFLLLFQTINALTECCQQQSIKLEFKDTEGNEQAHHGCKILLDEVEYGFAISKGKKSAKSDAALIAFVAYVKDLYNNSGKWYYWNKLIYSNDSLLIVENFANVLNMSRRARKPVFRVSDQVVTQIGLLSHRSKLEA